jgi:hypothetical protein
VCSLKTTSLSTRGNFNAPIYKLIGSKTDLRDWGAASSRSHGRPHEPWACWQAAGLGPCPQNLYCTIYLHCITSKSLDSQSKWLSVHMQQKLQQPARMCEPFHPTQMIAPAPTPASPAAVKLGLKSCCRKV